MCESGWWLAHGRGLSNIDRELPTPGPILNLDSLISKVCRLNQ